MENCNDSQYEPVRTFPPTGRSGQATKHRALVAINLINWKRKPRLYFLSSMEIMK